MTWVQKKDSEGRNNVCRTPFAFRIGNPAGRCKAVAITTRFAEFNTGEYVIRNVKNVLRIQIGVCGVRRLEVFLVENLLAET